MIGQVKNVKILLQVVNKKIKTMVDRKIASLISVTVGVLILFSFFYFSF